MTVTIKMKKVRAVYRWATKTDVKGNFHVTGYDWTREPEEDWHMQKTRWNEITDVGGRTYFFLEATEFEDGTVSVE